MGGLNILMDRFARWIPVLALLYGLNACLPADEKIVLPPPGDLTVAEADIGGTYAWRVYFHLGTGQSARVRTGGYDLAFESAPDGRRVFVNFANVARAVSTGNDDFSLPVRPSDYPDSVFNADAAHARNDSLAFDLWDKGETRPVFLLHRGEFQADAPAGLFQKVQILSVSENQWTFRYGKPDDPVGNLVTLPKDPLFSQTYFSFEDGPTSVEPPKTDWHLVFTRFTINLSEEAASTDYKFYSATGALLNHLAGVKAAKITPRTPGYIPFDSLKGKDVDKFPLSQDRDVIGYDWKEYGFETALYQIVPNVYYLIRTPEDDYYKLRFVGFYNASGRKGVPQFEYQRL